MQLDGQCCPHELKDSLRRYATQRIATGDFLRCVLANDLYGAVRRADLYNLSLLAHIASYVIVNMPPDSIGSYEAVDRWCELAHLAWEHEPEFQP